MSRYFPTRREAVEVSARGQTHTFFVRELGYMHLMEILRTAAAGGHSALDASEALVLATVEDAEGKPAYTKEEWRSEVKEVVEQITKEVKKAQGLDSLAKPSSEEESEGNE